LTETLLEVRNLTVSFGTTTPSLPVVDGVSFRIEQGEFVGLVGESGSGKTVTALSLTDLIAKPLGRIESGEVMLRGEDLTKMSAARRLAVRGRKIAMIFQEPMTALNPVHAVGKQIDEVLATHFPSMSYEERRQKCLGLLAEVGIPDPLRNVRAFPHQLSGGMRQRVMIAMALAAGPELLVADEPTTALDVTIQAQVLELIGDLQKKTGMAVLLITHDLAVVAQLCEKIFVMYAGAIVESGPVRDVLRKPIHPYTQGLVRCIPRLTSERKSLLPAIEGRIPTHTEINRQGCRFANRCPHQIAQCQTTITQLRVVGKHHEARCHLAEKFL
jgi:oligopeptide/dipeptide ABC transporter ATP-binding protein